MRLLDLYVSKLPNGAKEKNTYFTALPKTPEDPEKPWYSTVPIGWNKLDRMVKDIVSYNLRTVLDLPPVHCMCYCLQVRTGHKTINGLRV